MTLPLAGRTALVTGASRGIGMAAARSLAALGARVIAVARSAGALEAFVKELGPGAIALPADLTLPAAAVLVGSSVRTAIGGDPDIIVHAAGTFPLAPIAKTDDSTLDTALALNVAAPLRLTREFLPGMRARKSGDVVTIGSVADRMIFPDNAAYAASKHAVRAMHEVLRAETRGSGVRAILISPSATDTSIWDAHDPDGSPHLPSRSEMLRAEDVADAIAWAVTRPARVDVEELRISRS